MPKRGDLNEKRAKALFEHTDDPTRQPKWELQPDRIQDLFREWASYNTYKHDPTGRIFVWNMEGDKVVEMLTKEQHIAKHGEEAFHRMRAAQDKAWNDREKSGED